MCIWSSITAMDLRSIVIITEIYAQNKRNETNQLNQTFGRKYIKGNAKEKNCWQNVFLDFEIIFGNITDLQCRIEDDDIAGWLDPWFAIYLDWDIRM